MGRLQYSSPEAEAFGQIDQAVQDIESAVDDIDIILTELQSTDIANLADEVANLGFWDAYTPLNERQRGSKPNTWTSVYNINGEGYIGKLIISSKYACGARIYIDGVLEMELHYYNSNHSRAMGGIINNKNLVQIGDQSNGYDTFTCIDLDQSDVNDMQLERVYEYITSDDLPNYVGTTDLYSKCYVIEIPWFFTTSLDIQIQDDGFPIGFYGLIFEGGVK